jgi:hypothetical protein
MEGFLFYRRGVKLKLAGIVGGRRMRSELSLSFERIRTSYFWIGMFWFVLLFGLMAVVNRGAGLSECIMGCILSLAALTGWNLIWIQNISLALSVIVATTAFPYVSRFVSLAFKP